MSPRATPCSATFPPTVRTRLAIRMLRRSAPDAWPIVSLVCGSKRIHWPLESWRMFGPMCEPETARPIAREVSWRRFWIE
jgi:hypothetical protein